jgi:hypothetical protein
MQASVVELFNETAFFVEKTIQFHSKFVERVRILVGSFSQHPIPEFTDFGFQSRKIIGRHAPISEVAIRNFAPVRESCL